MLVVDTGVLVAAADDTDPDHRACVDLVEMTAEVLVTSPLVIAEAGYLIFPLAGPAPASSLSLSALVWVV